MADSSTRWVLGVTRSYPPRAVAVRVTFRPGVVGSSAGTDAARFYEATERTHNELAVEHLVARAESSFSEGQHMVVLHGPEEPFEIPWPFEAARHARTTGQLEWASAPVLIGGLSGHLEYPAIESCSPSLMPWWARVKAGYAHALAAKNAGLAWLTAAPLTGYNRDAVYCEIGCTKLPAPWIFERNADDRYTGGYNRLPAPVHESRHPMRTIGDMMDFAMWRTFEGALAIVTGLAVGCHVLLTQDEEGSSAMLLAKCVASIMGPMRRDDALNVAVYHSLESDQPWSTPLVYVPWNKRLPRDAVFRYGSKPPAYPHYSASTETLRRDMLRSRYVVLDHPGLFTTDAVDIIRESRQFVVGLASPGIHSHPDWLGEWQSQYGAAAKLFKIRARLRGGSKRYDDMDTMPSTEVFVAALKAARRAVVALNERGATTLAERVSTAVRAAVDTLAFTSAEVDPRFGNQRASNVDPDRLPNGETYDMMMERWLAPREVWGRRLTSNHYETAISPSNKLE